MSVRVINQMPQAKMQINALTSQGIRRGAQDLRRIARPKTPFKSGDLANRVLEQVLGLHGAVAWQVEYAPPQERGYWVSGPLAGVKIKNRPAGGQSKFAETSARQVARNGQKYFGAR